MLFHAWLCKEKLRGAGRSETQIPFGNDNKNGGCLNKNGDFL